MIDNNKKIYLTVKDYTVSGETFGLYRDEKMDMLITFPKPNENDLHKYYESENYISHTDGRGSLFEKLYQFIKGFALKNKVNLINDLHPQKGRLLDIGAGTGDFLAFAKTKGWDTTGIEPSEKAKSIALKKGVSFSDSTQVLENNSFDVITMWHVLEHVPNLEKQIKELKRLLKPEGTIIIAVPNFRSFDAKYYRRFWAGFDAPRHLWHFSKKAIKLLFLKEKMKVEKILPMKFDAFYVSLLSEKYKAGQMNFIRAFYIGLKSNYKAKKRFQYSSLIYVIKNAKNANKSTDSTIIEQNDVVVVKN
ncbi:2-polyprenyl-3-methyl-5-hydroxy-6-metoxy-1,4-benzoquinol methylase [Flavobacterium arsenatis]|uniref:2-polyprenyl-3-methyl-5-hydroxy-6-metoxy-1, 4-benzoquinol methylase n=1 Tax=Flavobacterium arsenatis TaxID=1484332 RepID=A0ABU1TU96_9FLAO|nr:class I SAM-dependent methyltransferase [Flavobacterium arsenatis]MDR6969455.1 2-polyprenyl-3-methyl-5-hydroxy-6-metoxy-1,4-benzoquinol methylase [Flavobacterium arsenatis]